MTLGAAWCPGTRRADNGVVKADTAVNDRSRAKRTIEAFIAKTEAEGHGRWMTGGREGGEKDGDGAQHHPL